MDLSQTDHERIAAAVAEAERGTSGEIRCVLASGKQDYRLSATVAASVAALIAPALAVAAGLRPDSLAGLFGGWTIGHEGAREISALTLYITLQAGIFAVVFALAAAAPLRRLLTPKARVKARVHAEAVADFEALGLTHTRDRTGVLIYANLAEHRAEVLADVGIYEKAPNQVWDAVVADLVAGLRQGAVADGFVAAVERCGKILGEYLPPRSDDANELPDKLNLRP